MNRNTPARTWSLVAGATLVAVGLLGFVPNPIVGGPVALATTDRVLNAIHILTGLAAVGIHLVATRAALRDAVFGFGALYALIFASQLVSPDLLGALAVPANGTVHLLHFVLAVGSLWLGYSPRPHVVTSIRRARTDEASG